MINLTKEQFIKNYINDVLEYFNPFNPDYEQITGRDVYLFLNNVNIFLRIQGIKKPDWLSMDLCDEIFAAICERINFLRTQEQGDRGK